MVIYFDDIWIYSHSSIDHLSHLRLLFEILHKEKLFMNLKKCFFLTDSVHILGFIILASSVFVDPGKVGSIRE